jgi:hypothetical protein
MENLFSFTISHHEGQPVTWSWPKKSFKERIVMQKKTGLGKGMAALFPVAEDESNNYFSCPIEEIKPNRNQPRKTFSPVKLEELAASIREKGIIQPLVWKRMAAMSLWQVSGAGGRREGRLQTFGCHRTYPMMLLGDG